MELCSCTGSKGNGTFGDEVVLLTVESQSETVTLSLWLQSRDIPCRWRSHLRSHVSELLVPAVFAQQASQAIQEMRDSEFDPEEVEAEAMQASSEELPGPLGSTPSQDEVGDEATGSEAKPRAHDSPRTVGKALLFAFLPSFGSGHRYAGAPFRGFLLALAEATFLVMAWQERDLAFLVPVVAVVLADCAGAVTEVRKQTQTR